MDEKEFARNVDRNRKAQLQDSWKYTGMIWHNVNIYGMIKLPSEIAYNCQS